MRQTRSGRVVTELPRVERQLRQLESEGAWPTIPIVDSDPESGGGSQIWITGGQLKIRVDGAVRTLARILYPLNQIPVLTADPSAPVDGEIWAINNGGTHQLCVRMAGTTRRLTLT